MRHQGRIVTAFLLVLLMGAVAPVSTAQALTTVEVVLWNRNYDTAPVDKIIALALDKTRDLYPSATLVRSRPLEQSEAVVALQKSDGLDVVSAALFAQHEADFLTIKFPVLKGLLGQRVCLIRKGQQRLFDGVDVGFDLASRNLKVCQGEHWPDSVILRRNGIPLATSSRYSELFQMLLGGQCDCFLRGVQEVGPELVQYEKLVDLESTLLFRYFQPGVIYVRRNDSRLAARIELGLLRAQSDGSYDQLFEALMRQQMAALGLEQRKIIDLNVPDLTGTQKAMKSIDVYWVDY